MRAQQAHHIRPLYALSTDEEPFHVRLHELGARAR